MKQMTILVNSICNQDCVFCSRPSEGGSIRFWEYADIIARAKKKNGSKELVINGGEPTLHKDLPKMVRYAKKIGIPSVALQTNGVRLSDPRYAKKLLENGVDVFKISLHSHKKGVAERLTQNRGSFEKTIRGIRNVRRLREGCNKKIILGIAHVITRLNYGQLPEFVRFVKKMCVTDFSIGFLFVKPQGNALKNGWVLPKLTQVELSLNKALKLCEDSKIPVYIGDCGLPLCFLPGYERYAKELDGTLTIAEVKKVTFWEEKVKSGDCRHCRYDAVCGGVHKEYAKMYGLQEISPVF